MRKNGARLCDSVSARFWTHFDLPAGCLAVTPTASIVPTLPHFGPDKSNSLPLQTSEWTAAPSTTSGSRRCRTCVPPDARVETMVVVTVRALVEAAAALTQPGPPVAPSVESRPMPLPTVVVAAGNPTRRAATAGQRSLLWRRFQ